MSHVLSPDGRQIADIAWLSEPETKFVSEVVWYNLISSYNGGP